MAFREKDQPMSQMGPQYHRGGSYRADEGAPEPYASPSGEWSQPVAGGAGGYSPDGDYPYDATGDVNAGRYDTRDYQRGSATPPTSRDKAESFGYDYRYAEGMDPYFVRSNPTGWIAFVISIVACALAWDRWGAFLALPVSLLALLLGLVALSLSGRRKWYVWLGVVFALAAVVWALLTVVVTIIALTGGHTFTGSMSLFGFIDLPNIRVMPIREISVTFPNSGLANLRLG